MAESDKIASFEVDQALVNQLVEFGFGRELSCLALKLTAKGDSLEEAIEILTSEEGADMQTLYEKVRQKEDKIKL